MPAAPWSRVVRLTLIERPRRGHIYRMQLECGHAVSRRLEHAGILHQPPRKARCLSCLKVLSRGRLPTQAGGELLPG